jgi:hypothetical protein
MRYTKFFINQTISKVKSNPALRKVAMTGYRAMHGTGKAGLGLLGLLFHPVAMGIIAAIIGIYMVFTLMGTMTSVMANMTSSTSTQFATNSVYGSTFSAFSGVTSLLPIVILAVVGMAAIVPMLGFISGSGRYGGVM